MSYAESMAKEFAKDVDELGPPDLPCLLFKNDNIKIIELPSDSKRHRKFVYQARVINSVGEHYWKDEKIFNFINDVEKEHLINIVKQMLSI